MKPVKRKLSSARRKVSNTCLLCFTDISPFSCDEVDLNGFKKRARLADFGVELVGGQKCSSFENKLEQMFILLKVLDVPRVWCEEVLLKWNETVADEGGDAKFEDDDWFYICSDCTERSVMTAWEIHRSIVTLQERMASVKAMVKEGMRRGIEERLKSRRNRFLEGRPEYEIRKLLFPDVFIKSEANYVEHGDWICFTDEADDDPFDEIGSNEDSKVEDLMDRDYTFPLKKVKAKRTKKRSSEKVRTTSAKRARRRKRKQTQKSHRSGELQQPPIWQTCAECKSRFNNEDEYTAHLRAHEENRSKEGGGEFTCSKCTFPAQTAEELEFHTKNRHVIRKRRYTCPKCPLSTDNWGRLREHVRQAHPSMTDDELETAGLILKCVPCGGKRFESLRLLILHRNKSHPELERSNANAGTEGTLPIPCPNCDVKFASEKLLDYHIWNVHKRQARFVCDACGKGFRFQSKLNKHKLIHLTRNEKLHVCDKCGLDFGTQQSLTNHYTTFHSSDSSPSSYDGKVFKCRFCHLTSHIPAVIKRHLESHKEELGQRCDKCGKYYLTAQGLTRHLKIKHGDGSWPCPHCSKVYPCEEYMKEHVRKFCKVKKMMAPS